MMNWLYYLLEANLYLVLFYGFYRLFLQNETFYDLNRYYLLVATLFSFIMPLLQIGFLKQPVEQMQMDYMMYTNAIPPPPVNPDLAATPANFWSANLNLLYLIYIVVAGGFALKLGLSIYKIVKLWRNSKKLATGEITLIEVNDESTAFSFFNLLFIHPQLAQEAAVIKHEMVHIRQKHSWDVLFFEVVQVICWFNPILPLLKKDVKLLHEYIADQLTTDAAIQKHEYALFLIHNSFGLRAQPITNQIFNQSILKRRINMLNKKRTAGWARLRLLLTIPLMGVMLCTSTMAFTKTYNYVDLLPEKSKKNPPRTPLKPYQSFKPKMQDRYVVNFRTDPKTGNAVRLEKRLIVANAKPLEEQAKFYGASNLSSVTILNNEEGKRKYGAIGANGVVELTGSNIKYYDQVPPPPPVEPTRVIKFPPPIVKPDKPKKAPSANIKFPPPIVTPDKPKKPSTGNIKFPPPIVKPDVVKPKMTEVDPTKQVEIVMPKTEMLQIILKPVDSTKKKSNN